QQRGMNIYTTTGLPRTPRQPIWRAYWSRQTSMVSKSRSTFLGRILKIGFVLLTFVLLGRFVILNWDEFKVVFTIEPRSFFLLSMCLMASFFCASARFAIIHRVIGAPIGYLEN